MKNSILLSIAFILTFITQASAYNVFPDSSGNILTLRITNTGNFSMPQVRVAKQNMPSWVTGFSPNEVNLGNIGANQSATATFTFNIPANASAGVSGDLSFQVSAGTGDSFSKNIALVVVTPTGAISGDVDVEGITETPYGALLTYVGPKNGSITLGITGGYTIENLPSGIYRVTVSKSGFVPVPAYRDVTVVLGQTTSGIDFDLIKPPQPPNLHSPTNNSTVNIPRPNLDWDTAQGGGNKRYQIQVATNNGFSQALIDVSNITNTDYTPTFDLSNNTTYYWRVRTTNEAGTSDWSSIWGFTTRILPAKPMLLSPSNGTTISDSDDVSLSWNSVSNASSYRLQVANNSSFGNPVVDTTQSSTNYTAYNLSNNTTYYWRVLANNSIGNSPFSNTWWFRIDLKGRIEGDVDGPGMSQSGATVQATGPVTRSVSTGWSGGYTISDLPPGNYTVTVSQSGYTSNPANRQVTVTAGQTTSWVDFTLVSIYGAISGDVDSPDTWGQYNATVQATGPVIRSVSTGWFGGYDISDLTPGNYTVTCSKSGYVSSPSSRNISVIAGQTTNNIDFDLTPTQSRATILLSSDSAIRNNSSYYPYMRTLRSISNKGSLTSSELLILTTPVIPILSSGEVNLSVETSRPVLDTPSLAYTIGEEKPENITLSGSRDSFSAQLFIESTTPEGTGTFNYSAIDETGTPSDQIEYGREFIIDTTIYPDEGGLSQNRDGSSLRLEAGALPIAVNITITQPPLQRGLSVLNENNSNALLSTMRQFSAQIDGKEVVYEGRTISSINQIANEIKGLTINLPYFDQNQDGITDDGMLDENSLRIYQLRENSWQGIENCQIDKERNIVSASVNSFGTYILSGARVITDINSIICYPNPWYLEKESFARITFIPLNSNPRVYIYNIAGELTRTLDDNQEIISTGQGYLEARWDGRNDSGRDVAYGVYIYVAETDKGTKKGKIGVIR